jgi:hypothetical protein
MINTSLRHSYAVYASLCDAEHAMERVQQTPHIVSGFLPCPEEPYRMARPPDHSAEYRMQLTNCERTKRETSNALYLARIEKDIQHFQRLLRDEGRKAAGRRYMETLWDGTRVVTDETQTRKRVVRQLESVRLRFVILLDNATCNALSCPQAELERHVRTLIAQVKDRYQHLTGGLGRYLEPSVRCMLENLEGLTVFDRSAVLEVLHNTNRALDEVSMRYSDM